MALIKNQYGTFYTDKEYKTPMLPVTEELDKEAQRVFGKKFNDLSVSQRFNIRNQRYTKDPISYQQYLDDYKNMAADPDYIPKYVKGTVGVGQSAQQIAAKLKAREIIPNFDQMLGVNLRKRRRERRKEVLKLDPEKKQIEMAKKAERRRRRRVAKLADKGSLTPDEKFLNYQQSLITRQLNDKIKKNPNLILKNPKLMDQLSTTVSKDGDIIKIKPTLTEDTLKTRGVFEIEHQRDVFKKGAMKDFPYNRNLIMAPHNRTGGFKQAAESFIEKNPNSPKVENILKKAEELKITLQPNVPKGTFKTKGLGYKQLPNAVEKFIDVAKTKVPLIVDKNIGLPSSTKDLTMAKKALGFKGKAGLAVAGALALTGTATADELPIKYNDEIGAFVDPKNDDKVSQATLLNWAADNPMPTAAVASAPLLSKTVRKGAGKLLSGLLSTLGSSAAGLTFAGMTVKGNLEDGKNIVDATVDPMVGIELLYPEAAKRFGGKGLQNALGRALSLGRVGAMMTPVGMGITALGIGKSLYNIAQEEQDRINEMRENDPIAYQEYLKEQQELMDVSA